MRRIFTLIILCALVAAGAAHAFDLSRLIGGGVQALQAASVDDAQMAQYVHGSVEAMDKKNKVLPSDNPYSIRLARLTRGITDADGIPLNFKVYQTDEVNAFACPDGSVRVYTGLMDRMTDDEVLGVIGHEIGHVVKRHSLKAFRQQLLTGAFANMLGSTSNTMAALTDSQYAQLGEAFVSAQYSQKQESEADDCGYDFLKAQGRNPWGMVMAFQKIQALEGTAGQQSTLAKAFSDHPDTQSRIEHMAARCRRDGIQPPRSSGTVEAVGVTQKDIAPRSNSTVENIRNSARTSSQWSF